MISATAVIVYMAILAGMYWLAMYGLDIFSLSHSADKQVRVTVTMAIAVVYVLLGAFGLSGVQSVPHLRFYHG
jgi:hypothetical protein